MIQRDPGDGSDAPASPPVPGHEDADPERPLYPEVTVHHLTAEIFRAESYTESLAIVMRYVTVT